MSILILLVISDVTQPSYFIKYYQAWKSSVWTSEVCELSFLVLVFCFLKGLQLCLNHLVIFSHFLPLTMPPKLLPSYKFWYFFYNKNHNINNILVCLIVILNFHLQLVASILLMLHIFKTKSILFMLHLLIESFMFMLHLLTKSVLFMLHHLVTLIQTLFCFL